MTDDVSAETPLKSGSVPATGGVSVTRTRISLGLLVISVTILGLELRSKLGPLWTGLQFAKMSEDGAFTNATISDVRRHLSLFPSEAIDVDAPDETIYCYTWYSPLEHFRRSPRSELFVVGSKDSPPRAVVYFNDRETPEEHAKKLARAFRISEMVTGGNRNRQVPEEQSQPSP
jgi:hypothetical protein